MLHRSSTRRFAGALSVILFTLALPVSGYAAVRICASPLAGKIPARTTRAPSGSETMNGLLGEKGPERDKAVVRQVLAGNVPAFLRQLTPVSFAGTLASGQKVRVTICVTPDYLAVGNDRDFVRVPMGLAAAARVADQLGFMLPTTKMVDAIYRQAKVQLAPRPMTPGSRMTSTPYLIAHDKTLDAQRGRTGRALTDLTAGDKKDIVLTTRLRSHPGRVAIYGWHRANGRPIQPLSTVHGASYADYSHGVRLVSQTAYVDGKPQALADILSDRDLSRTISREGPIRDARRLMASLY